ncbi:hypothetical protein [Hephaestia mangrovi]|uniref:hypothetical protein n=1 Tax=Hephaestia mangrovi TaxID=2873268 RepID=UPI001CA72D12|nr:hypothetical protein [Hephaestia mangrovi]MBY8829139.1 hypothetical protein [Hephaestia mangrovi]
MIGRPFLSVSLAAMVAAMPASAAQAPFDLQGPAVRVSVTHDGTTLPISEVPNLATGDTLSLVPDLPSKQGARYVLIGAFLRGATNPPPKDWFFEAKTWKDKKKDNSLSLTVPEGARQFVLLLMPQDNGDFDAVVSAVRKQPGTFVRASQELNQASLDRARLDAFLGHIHDLERDAPDRIADVSPVLTRSLSIKLNADCLQKPVESQAACLTQDRESLLLADTHSSELAETLSGAPTDLAFQISSTAKAGYGYYSPYIGVVRDLARIFGAFQTTQLQYIPAITREAGDRMSLLLNAAPSFGKPASVMVIGMPAIEPVQPPPLRRAGDQTAFCARGDDLLLPVEGAPLVYATGYAHDMVLRVPRKGATSVDLPATADPARGGYVITGKAIEAAGIDADAEARLHGRWGFAPFDGPSFTLQVPPANGWKPADDPASVVVGRDNQLVLAGGAPACISGVSLDDGNGPPRQAKWQAAGDGRISVALPLDKADPGPMTLLIDQRGGTTDRIALTALAQAGHFDALTLHAGDADAMLTGTRLDTVASVSIGSATFKPGALKRVGDKDTLDLDATDMATAQALAAGSRQTATIALTDGRTRRLSLTVLPPRPQIELIQRSVAHDAAAAGLPISVGGDVVTPGDRLTFSLRATGNERLTGAEKVELATADGRASATIDASDGYTLQSDTVAIVTIDPAKALGPAAFGPIRFRLWIDGVATGWTPLASLVRLPAIDAVSCTGSGRCTLAGNRLFLIDRVAPAADMAGAMTIPDGFTDTTLTVPRPRDGKLYLTLRDDPALKASVAVRR